ncbi:MAG: DUF3999 domain-containing protein [Deferribacteraceae bacterium]|jgi:hypothetical protein|nr:DUF3999 domain-containing protein [Deferribacteraceae bacterium]
MIKFLYIALFLAVLLSTAHAANILQPSDFEYGFKVDVPQREALYGLTLPAHFYENIKNADASDIVVFNADNEPVPFTVRRPMSNNYKIPDNQPAPFFIINDETKKNLAEIIIDLTNLSQMPDMLKLTFAGDKEFNASVNIYVSSGELNDWSVVSNSVNIAQLTSADSIIIKDTIKLPALPLSSKYLKIQTSPPKVIYGVNSVYFSFPPMPVYEKARELTVENVYDISLNRNHALFDTKGHYPVEWIHFDIPPSYLFPDFTLSVRNSDNESWQTLRNRARISDYPLNTAVNGIGVQNTRSRHWQLTVEGALPAQNSSAVFYWRADELIFIAKGTGPYTVAYGYNGFKPNAAIASASYALTNSEMTVSNISPAIKPTFIGEINRDTDDYGNIKNYLLFGVTLLVIAVLTRSAVKLIRDVNKKSD